MIHTLTIIDLLTKQVNKEVHESFDSAMTMLEMYHSTMPDHVRIIYVRAKG